MNQLDIEKALSLNKEVTSGNKKNVANKSMLNGNTQKTPKLTVDPNNIDSFEDMIFGDYNPSEDTSLNEEYDPNKELKMLKEKKLKPREDIKNSNIPPQILESIIKNPIDVEVSINDDIDEFITSKGIAPDNIKAINSINERLEKYENGDKPIEEKKDKSFQTINQDNLVKLIENIFDKKIKELKTVMLNESKNSQDNSMIKGFKMTSNGNFLFLASNDDLYECKMRYLGKNKRRKKR